MGTYTPLLLSVVVGVKRVVTRQELRTVKARGRNRMNGSCCCRCNDDRNNAAPNHMSVEKHIYPDFTPFSQLQKTEGSDKISMSWSRSNSK